MGSLKINVRMILCSSAFVAFGFRQRHSVDGTRGKEGLCAPAIVQETCSLIGNAAGDGQVTFQEVKEMLAATEASLDALWKKAELPGDRPMKCAMLCHSMVDLLSKSGVTLPASSDTGCYTKGGQQHCDLDLSPKAVAAMGYKKDMPDFHDRQYLARATPDRGPRHRRAARPGAFLQVGHVGESEISKLPDAIKYTNPITVAVRIANLYRIYPYTHVTAEDIPLAKPSSLAQRDVANASSLTEPNGNVSAAAADVSTAATVVSAAPTDVSDSNTQAVNGLDMSGFSGDWKVRVQQRSFQAQAYVTNAIRKHRLEQTKHSMEHWFGEASVNDEFMNRELLRVLNSVSNILSNVDYRPGSNCRENVYAYVVPRSEEVAMDGDQFLFFLCPLYLSSDEALQIETLTHEASHHATAFTADVCMDAYFNTKHQGKKTVYVHRPLKSFSWNVQPGDYLQVKKTQYIDGTNQTEVVTVSSIVRFVKELEDLVIVEEDPIDDCSIAAYGRDICRILGTRDHFKAIRNADSICYFISDVTDIV